MAALKDVGLTWEIASKQPKNQQIWRSLVEDLCATQAPEDKREKLFVWNSLSSVSMNVYI